MSQTLYKKFVKRWEEVTELPPQKLGIFTPYYHLAVKKLKVMPWPVYVFAAFGFSLFLYVILGGTLPLFVSILQRGF